MSEDGTSELESGRRTADEMAGAVENTDAEAGPQSGDDLSQTDCPAESRDEEIERLRSAAVEADKRVLQAQAEAENFRKRMRRDFEDQLKFASTDLVLDLLQVRDNLLRAIDAAAAGDQADSDQGAGLQGAGLQGAALAEGVSMVIKQMDDVFAKHGVEEIPADGEVFDPNVHEAISQVPSDVESGRVAHVAQSGFRLHQRVIRPSQVVVSTGPAN